MPTVTLSSSAVSLRGWLYVLFLTGLITSATASAQTWTLNWNDEFDGAANSPIDATKWLFEHGDLKVNNELEFYCAPTDAAPCDPAKPNAFIDGAGHLVIQAVRVSDAIAPSSNAWTSARLNTSNKLASFHYGRIESRMQLPVGPGIWPAFWSLGTDIGSVDWPTCGEMDFMENVPASGGLGPGIVKSTIHGPGYSGGDGIGKDFPFPGDSDVSASHTYGTIWSPFMVQFYVDDPANVFFVRTARDIPAGKQWVYNHPFFLLLNLAVGGTGSWPGPPDSTTASPARMLVDYVRAYKPSLVPPPTAAVPTPISVTAGSAGSSTVELTATPGSGRMYVDCSTDAVKSSCVVSTGNRMSDAVADFTTASTVAATVHITTTPNTASATETASRRSGLWGFAAIPGCLLLFATAWLPGWRVAQKCVQGLALLTALSWMISTPGCGGGSSDRSNNGTAPGTYTITLNAYTVSSDPNNATSYGTVAIPLTVK